MRRYLAFVTLILASLPGFGSHAQPSRSNQFHANKSHTSHKANSKAASHRPGGASAASATVKASTNTAVKGRFKNGVRGPSSVSTVSFVAGTRTAWGGTDDGETESVMGDFNGDGKMDVARTVTDSGGNPQVSVLLSNGDGTFQAAAITGLPLDTDAPLLVGDLNGDGKDDLVLVQPYGGNCTRTQKAGALPTTLPPCGASIYVLISNGDGTFAAAVNYAVTPASLQGGLLTDINGDGKLDVLAFDNSTPANVLELLGNGDGTFAAASSPGTLTTNTPGNMLFADFNGDGNIDFAGQSESGQLQVTLATGAGLYANAPVSLSTPDGNYGACNSATGDLTGDGKAEIVSFNCYANTVTVYVNQGDGSFGTGIYYDNNSDQYQNIYDGAIADMNGDGKNDVVVVNDYAGDVSVFLGHGDGSLAVQPLSYDVGGYAWNTPLIADFNGDGHMDVVESDDLYNLVYLQGYGDGTFRAGATNPLPNSFDQYAWTYSVASGDFNGDGIADVVAGQFRNDGATGVVVYLGKGDGTFYPGVNYGQSDRETLVTVADFNGDGILDIAAIDQNNDVVQIFLGDGDGTFSVAGSYLTSPGSQPSPQSLVVGDFNKDGKMDIAVANSNTADVGVLLGRGDGTFAPAVSYAITGYYDYNIATADLNGDGYLDLAVTAYTDGPPAIGILLADSNAPGTFGTVSFVPLNGYPNNVALGDLNNDGKIDMVVTERNGLTFNGQIEIFLNDGTGTFAAAPTAYPASTFGGVAGNSFPLDIQLFDINGDGNLDLVYVNDSYGTLAVALGNGDGTIGAPTEFPSTEYVAGLALADVNGDGAMDVLTGEDEAGGFSVFLNANGSGAGGNYTLGTTTPSGTVTAGGSATYTLNLTGSNGYTGTISFACSNLPQGTTCTFNPATVIANGNVPLSTVVTIQTTAASSASLLQPALPHAQGGSQSGPAILLATFGGMGLVGLCVAGSGPKGRRRRAGIVLAVVVLLTLGTMVGCGSSSTTTTTTTGSTGTPAGAYAVTVTSTGTGTGAPTHSITLTLVVQ